MWFFVGLAISGASLASDGDGPPLFVCLIPVAIGLAYLVYYFAEERKGLPNSAVNSTL
jgi:lipopolysaccharide export LptBFGC system permease protein LptF